jgi:hypothetical protein
MALTVNSSGGRSIAAPPVTIGCRRGADWRGDQSADRAVAFVLYVTISCFRGFVAICRHSENHCQYRE